MIVRIKQTTIKHLRLRLNFLIEKEDKDREDEES